MILTDRLKTIAAELGAVRESLNISRPGQQFSPSDLSMSRRDRMIQLRQTPQYLRSVAECARLIAGAQSGAVPHYILQEAMSTSDFPYLMGDVMYRQLLGNYQPYPVTYPNYFKIVDLKDFRALHMYALDGGSGLLPGPLKEYEPYPEIVFQESPYSVAVKKYGQQFPLSFEMLINDDLNAFSTRPQQMVTGCRRSEEYLATTMLCDVNGPHATFFTSGNKNIITGNPALSLPALQTAQQLLADQKDKDGQPIIITAAELIVTPHDEITAQNILNASELRLAEAGGSSNQLMYVQNWMKAKLRLSVNPYIKYVASSAAAYPWFLVASTADQTATRPAFVFAFMRGRRNPQMFVKDPDAIAFGGGTIGPEDGDFDNDGIRYKVRHIFGAAQVDPKMAVSSNGTGS